MPASPCLQRLVLYAGHAVHLVSAVRLVSVSAAAAAAGTTAQGNPAAQCRERADVE